MDPAKPREDIELRRMRYRLTDDQIRSIIDHADALGGAAYAHRNRVVLRLLAVLGLRVSELVGLNVTSIKVAGESSELRVDGKGGRVRVLQVPRSLAQDIWTLQSIQKGRGPVGRQGSPRPLILSRRNARLSRSAINRIVAAAAEAAGVQSPSDDHRQVWPHLFRHSLAKRLKANGVDDGVIQRILGHKRRSTTTEIYQAPAQQEIAEALEQGAI